MKRAVSVAKTIILLQKVSGLGLWISRPDIALPLGGRQDMKGADLPHAK